MVEIKKDKYVKSISHKGVKTLNNGDEVASILGELSEPQLFKLSKSLLGVNLKKQYQHLNAGMKRMNIGNRIRSHLRTLESQGKNGIKVLKKEIKSLD